jgi:hypothetical protein
VPYFANAVLSGLSATRGAFLGSEFDFALSMGVQEAGDGLASGQPAFSLTPLLAFQHNSFSAN